MKIYIFWQHKHLKNLAAAAAAAGHVVSLWETNGMLPIVPSVQSEI